MGPIEWSPWPWIAGHTFWQRATIVKLRALLWRYTLYKRHNWKKCLLFDIGLPLLAMWHIFFRLSLDTNSKLRPSHQPIHPIYNLFILYGPVIHASL